MIKSINNRQLTMDADLSEEWLELTNRLALAGQLLSGTLHDVNNFLQGISGNAELLEAAARDDERTARRARLIVTNAGQASASLSSLQVVLRDVDGAERVDLHALASQALALRGYGLKRARIETAVERAGGAAIAVARTRSVLQIVLNLILNAEQALATSRDGRLRILVAARVERVELTVEDNGAGLPGDVASRPFEPQIGRSPGRLGIGLMVSDRLARAQSGTLSHSVPPGGGCAMTLSLPAAAQDSPPIR